MSKLEPILKIKHLTVLSKGKTIFHPLSFNVHPNTIQGIMGPSGIGKSTLLKCLNRLTDLEPALKVKGSLIYRGKDILSLPAEEVRKKIGMVFQAPVIFPGTIERNVLFGVRHLMPEKKKIYPEILETSLREAALWEEVKDRLCEKAEILSMGQKQRLSIARVLALRPDVLLLDEPTSALDTRSTELIEDLFVTLKRNHTLVLVTHDSSQAERISDHIVQMVWDNCAGKLEVAPHTLPQPFPLSEPISLT